MDNWISVKDRLPESGEHILACCEMDSIYGGKKRYVCDAFHAEYKSIEAIGDCDLDCDYDEETDEYYFPEGWYEVIKNWDEYSCILMDDTVTHWMPLPDPPEEVEKDG